MTGERLSSRDRLGTTLISSPRGRKPDAEALPTFPPTSSPRPPVMNFGEQVSVRHAVPRLSSCPVGKGARLPAGLKTSRHTAHCTTSHPHAYPLAHDQILKPSPALTGHLTPPSPPLMPFHTRPLLSDLNNFLPPGSSYEQERVSVLYAIPPVCTHVCTQALRDTCACTHTALQRVCLAPGPGSVSQGGR